MRILLTVLLGLLGLFGSISTGAQTEVLDHEWSSYARTPEGTRYSPLNQITTENAHQLKKLWTVQTGDIARDGKNYWEVTPLMVNNTLYVMTLFNKVMALDPVTGEEKWVFDPEFNVNRAQAVRGVAYWEEDEKRRIILTTRDARMFCINADDGTLDQSFSNDGMIDLRERFGEGDDKHYMFVSSPPAVCGDVIIQGFGMGDGPTPRMPHVPIVAVNAHTGKTMWTFNTIPQEGEWGRDTWQADSWFNRGGANAWSIMSVDPEHGLVYVPTGAAQFDFYGGDRHGDNLFANSIIALDAETGERKWHFQTVHHDIWDYDIPAQPNLVDLTIDGESIPAVAQVSKTGFVYVLNRLTGEPVFDIVEKPVPASDVPGEKAAPTQPFPSAPPAFSRQGFDENDVNDMFPEEREKTLERLKGLRADGFFTPPSFKGSVNFPGFHGGANWSGAAVTPDGMMYINSTELPGIIRLVHADEGLFRYKHTGWIRFRDSLGYPACKPPWGQLNKIDLNKGEIVWQVPLGEYKELSEQGFPVTGQENFGGATVTAGDVILIASTKDEHFRVFDTTDGTILFEEKLPAGGYAAPITYLGEDGKQYITLCAGGGGKIGTPPGDYIITYTLDN